jgi:hypothetical protein
MRFTEENREDDEHRNDWVGGTPCVADEPKGWWDARTMPPFGKADGGGTKSGALLFGFRLHFASSPFRFFVVAQSRDKTGL